MIRRGAPSSEAMRPHSRVCIQSFAKGDLLMHRLPRERQNERNTARSCFVWPSDVMEEIESWSAS